jgi:hypothetical protein
MDEDGVFWVFWVFWVSWVSWVCETPWQRLPASELRIRVLAPVESSRCPDLLPRRFSCPVTIDWVEQTPEGLDGSCGRMGTVWCALAEWWTWTSSPQNRSASISTSVHGIPQPRFALRLTLPPPLGASLPHCLAFAYFFQLPPLRLCPVASLPLLLPPNFPLSQRYPTQPPPTQVLQHSCNLPRQRQPSQTSHHPHQPPPACLCSRSSRRQRLASTSSPSACKFTTRRALVLSASG